MVSTDATTCDHQLGVPAIQTTGPHLAHHTLSWSGYSAGRQAEDDRAGGHADAVSLFVWVPRQIFNA